MINGWEILALYSAGDPSQAQGFDVDLYHIDEDTANIGWYEEAVGRTAMTKGKIRWTALPHSKNDDILNMMQRAEEEAHLPNPSTISLRASMFDNPYYPKESRDSNMKIWASQGEDVLRKRAYGELVMDSLLMYPTFSKYIHNTRYEEHTRNHEVLRIWEDNNGTPPRSWCLSMIVDPGHTICAVLFVATPPPALGDFRFFFNELYLHKCDAEMFGIEVEKKIKNCQYERFIIDAHGGRLTDFGSGITPQRQYELQLRKRNLVANSTSSYFINGSDDVPGREQMLREWLRVRDDGLPKVLVDIDKCPNFIREIDRFKKKQQRFGSQMIVLDEANRRAACHLVECAEYAAAHGLEYVAPRKTAVHNSWVTQVLKERKVRAQQRWARGAGATKNSISLSPRGVT
jgi:hypothetical protein